MSDQSLASIGIQITSNAGTAAQDLDKLVGAGTQADAVVNKLGTTSKDAAAQVANVGAAAKTLGAAQSATNQTIKAATISSAQYAQSLRLLPIQIHQGFDQLLYGTNPLIVLSTQLPQISESFGGLGNALKAFGSIVTPTVLGIGTLAAAIGTVGYAWYEAAEEQDDFTKKLITTGDAVGLTTDQIEALAKQIQDAGVSHGDAVSALMAALSAGITKNVGGIAQLAAQLEELGGIPIAQTVKEFASLGGDPVKAAESLQKTLAFLTPQIYAEITALEKQGQVAQATNITQQQLSKSLTDQVELLKEMQGGWSGVAQAVKSFFSNTFSDLGQLVNPGLEKQIANIKAQIAFLKANNPTGPYLAGNSPEELQKKLDALQAEEAKFKSFSSSGQQNASATNAKIQANPATQANQAAQLSAASIYGSISETAQSDQIQRALQANLADYQRYGALLDADHSAHLISDQAYYAAKEHLIDADTDATVAALKAQNDALGQQIAKVEAAAAAFNSLPHTPAETTKNDADAQQKVAALTEKILDNNAAINKAIADGTNKVELQGKAYKALGVQAQETLARLKDGQNAYLGTLERGYQLQLSDLTAGPNEKQALQDISQENAHYLEAIDQLDQANRIKPDPENYATQLAIIKDTHRKALADTDAYYMALDKAQADWSTGAKAALSTYQESAHDVAGQAEGLFTDAFAAMGDAAAQFATTGSLSFKNFADSVIGDLARILVKEEVSGILSLITGGGSSMASGTAAGLAGALTNFTPELSNIALTALASGGPISGPAIVGEKGPELFIPDTSGYVVPNNKLGSALGGPVINFSPSYQIGSGVDRAQVLAAMDATHKRTIADMSRLIKGGAFRS